MPPLNASSSATSQAKRVSSFISRIELIEDFMPNSKVIHPRMPLLMPDCFSDLHLCAWRIEQAKQDENNPLLEGEMPWDRGGVGIHGTLLKDPIDGLFKAWLVGTPPEETDEGWANGWSSVANDRDRSICYYESKDGVRWTRPELGTHSYGDHPRTNLIFPSSKFGLQAYASVLIDPNNREFPYQMWVLQTDTPIAKSPHGYGYQRYRSKDGKHWDWVSGPITGCILGDVLFVYDGRDFGRSSGYVGYYRTGCERQEGDHVPAWEDSARRTCFRCISEDGNTWTKDDVMIITRDERDHRDTQFMECVPHKVPGGYVALVSAYHPLSQTLDLRMAASRDGQNWWFPDRYQPAMPNRPLGEYGGGMLWQTKNLIEDGKTLWIYYAGTEGAHRQISDTRAPSIPISHQETALDHGAHFLPFTAALCRASWEIDRLYALVSSSGGPTPGYATTKPQEIGGKTLSLNFSTRNAKKSPIAKLDEGFIAVELLDAKGSPIDRFREQDCNPLSGDHRNQTVTWRGGQRIPSNARQAKFKLKRAFLYGFQFQ
jgi:hypothetical protein